MKRNKELDIFRGLTICLMIIVNTPGSWSSVYAPFLHADWHGFTPTDWVFPAFLFAVGTAFAFVRKRWAEKTFSDVAAKILKRTFLIFILGYTMYWFPFVKWSSTGELVASPLSETRIWGVLQRIAICYFAAAIMIFYLKPKQLIYTSIGILLGYWAILAGFGDLSLENNAVRHLDLFLFGENHLYGGEGIAFDPEGLLSTLPSIINVIGGYLAGVFIIKNQEKAYQSIAMLMIAGASLAALAYFWGYLFPINKKLWTSSFVLLNIGLDLMLMGILIYLMRVKEKPFRFGFFDVFGKNPLFIYLLSQYLVILLYFFRINGENLYGLIYENGFKWMGAHLGSFVFAMLFMMLCWVVGWWLDKKKIYIRV